MQQGPRDARRKKPERQTKRTARGVGGKKRRDMPHDFLSKAITVNEVLQYTWSPRLFCHWMERFSGCGDKKKLLRQAVLWGTRAKAESMKIGDGSGGGARSWYNPEVVLRSYGVHPLRRDNEVDLQQQQQRVWIVANDTLECGTWIAEEGGVHITCLVMASRSKLGGGYEKGSKAQEEDIYRCSAISSLHEEGDSLALDSHLRVFSQVNVFRGSEEFGYPFIKTFKLDMLSMAAISNPSIEGDDVNARMDKVSTRLMEMKVAKIVDQAVKMGSHHLILGAWGCGVYACPPSHIAEIMRQALKKAPSLHNVYIAIPDRGSKSRANFEAFMKHFKQPMKVRLVPSYQRRAIAFELCLCWNRVQFVPRDVLKMIVAHILSRADPSITFSQ